jgi:hypothetical protein
MDNINETAMNTMSAYGVGPAEIIALLHCTSNPSARYTSHQVANDAYGERNDE